MDVKLFFIYVTFAHIIAQVYSIMSCCVKTKAWCKNTIPRNVEILFPIEMRFFSQVNGLIYVSPMNVIISWNR